MLERENAMKFKWSENYEGDKLEIKTKLDEDKHKSKKKIIGYIHECSDQDGTTIDPPEVLHARVPPHSSVSNRCSSNGVHCIPYTRYPQQGELEECSMQYSDDVIWN